MPISWSFTYVKCKYDDDSEKCERGRQNTCKKGDGGQKEKPQANGTMDNKGNEKRGGKDNKGGNDKRPSGNQRGNSGDNSGGLAYA